MSTWPHYTYIEDLIDRINLRSKVLGGATTNLLPYPSRSNYQKVTVVSNIQRALEQIVGRIAGSPTYGQHALNLIVEKNYDGTAPTTTYPTVGWNLVNSVFTPLTWTYVQNNALGGHDWETMYHREVVDNTSTTDYYGGQAFADGQRAYRHSDRQIVDRVAGAWVPNTTATHADYVTNYRGFAAGDFFMEKLFTQIEAVLALLTTVGAVANWTAGASSNHIGQIAASDPSLATARSACEAAYAAATADVSSSPRAYNSNTQNSGPGDYNAFLERAFAYPNVGSLSPLIAKSVTFYGFADPYIGLTNYTFDAFGDPVLDRLLKTCDSGSASAAATSYTGAQVGSLTVPTPPWATDPDPTHDNSRGYNMVGVFAAIKYSF